MKPIVEVEAGWGAIGKGRSDRAARVHLSVHDEMPRAHPCLRVDAGKQPLRLGVLKRKGAQPLIPVPREQAVDRPAAETAIGVVEENRRPFHYDGFLRGERSEKPVSLSRADRMSAEAVCGGRKAM